VCFPNSPQPSSWQRVSVAGHTPVPGRRRCRDAEPPLVRRHLLFRPTGSTATRTRRPASKVGCKNVRGDSEIVREPANHLPAESLLPRLNLGDRGLGNRRVPTLLRLRDFLGFYQVPKRCGLAGWGGHGEGNAGVFRRGRSDRCLPLRTHRARPGITRTRRPRIGRVGQGAGGTWPVVIRFERSAPPASPDPS
jgi:hypothetical protein